MSLKPEDLGWSRALVLAEVQNILYLAGSAVTFLLFLVSSAFRSLVFAVLFSFGSFFGLVLTAALAGAWYFGLKKLTSGTSCNYTANLAGKVVIITGANTGIGKPTAQELCKMGATVVLACRSVSKGEAAAAEIRKNLGVKEDRVLALELDLGSFASIRKFAKEIDSRSLNVDILINNAGVMACPFSKTADGLELQNGTNHFGHFLLTNLLLPKIERSNGRIVNLSSVAYFGANKFNFDEMSNPNTYEPWKSYCCSKLANVLFSRELQRRLKEKGSKATVYIVHPGSVATELQRYQSAIEVAAKYLPLFKNPLEGAQTSIYCAIHPKAIPGIFYGDCQPCVMTKAAWNDVEAKQLWELSEKICGL